MKQKPTILGWSEGKSVARFYDPTGVYHLVITEQREGLTMTRAACNRRRVLSGQTERAPDNSHRCRICQRIARKHGYA